MKSNHASMATYGLSFSSEFYLDGDLLNVKPSARPTSVYQAIIGMRDDAWRHLAEDVFGCEAEWLDPIDVLAKVGETNACGNLDSPVEVWIDEDGDHVLRIYDAAE